ncbi:HPF/RaiA family ribosome-associated protein [Bdellovibrio bacteriovorus]|uniref:HPF/RaiA family ribosome-associated protein n=1 Tax=Bdellovibrio bacteriovorus TaxID=959 RepID=UPI0035A736B2
MQTDIYYRDITKTENLESYLLETVEGTVGDFFKYDSGAHLTVRVETDRHRSQTRKPSYVCEVILKPSRSKTVIKVVKRDENFKRCVAKTVSALKGVLSKRSSRKSQHRRNDPMLEFQPMPLEGVA